MAFWAIVLAGGRGSRLQQRIVEWFGHPHPKQFCTFCGTRSLLEHTVHRATGVVGDRIAIVINESHAGYLRNNLPGMIIEQPEDKGTATGAFLAATHIRALDEDATIVVLPSDHFIYPEDKFVEQLRQMSFLAEAFSDRLVLAGANPTSAEPDYGWIKPGYPLRDDLWNEIPPKEVASFHEKPSPEETEDLFRSNCYWNTMIVATRLKTLWTIGSWTVPVITDRFTEFFETLSILEDGTVEPASAKAISRLLYRDMPAVDLSRDILARAAGRSLVYPLRDIYWRDWGRPERILQTIDDFGLQPNFIVDEKQNADSKESVEDFTFKIGTQVRSLMNGQAGVIRDRWISGELNYVEETFGPKEVEIYEIAADRGGVFAETGDNLALLSFTQPKNRKAKNKKHVVR